MGRREQFPARPARRRRPVPRSPQFLYRKEGDGVYDQFRRLHFKAALRYRGRLPDELRLATGQDIEDWFGPVMDATWDVMVRSDESEPHRVLAGLPFSVYLTTNPDDAMAAAPRAADKTPAIEVCPWFQPKLESLSSAAGAAVAAAAASKKPDHENPLVYHLFGRFSRRESMVLTEDDYLDYMLGVALNKDLILPSVLRAMKDNRLLFLGFPIDHWTFRALLRTFCDSR